ncbi:glycosyltransferase family 2 protein [Jannaschia formosa]|uniref:glycosyltransferase family 2 protein n=1 Tax=Jannaschia formosa TaxID=2259592 RepID=UPI000E1BA1A1|nr:glycosyltransferase family A protein [Jannaschia formosa]TFL19236.1 glycosyltransferase family 2 protein [Jannaschia formosa]
MSAADASPAPLLTVIVPVHDRETLVAGTIRSLVPAVAAGVEVLIVDDGSRDRSLAVAEATVDELGIGHAVRVLSQPNAGPGAARNTGAAAARTPWLAFLDSDDLWLPWTAPTLLDAILRPDPPAAIFLAPHVFTDTADLSRLSPAAAVVRRHPTLLAMRGAPDRLSLIGSCNFAVRADAFAAAAGFTERTRCAEDSDLFYRLGDLGPVDSIAAPALVAFRTMGQASLTQDTAQMAAGYTFLLAREEAGAYGAPSPERSRVLGLGAAFAVRRIFARGQARLAYRLLWQARNVLREALDAATLLKLWATPLLALLRPRNHRFDWRALLGGERA